VLRGANQDVPIAILLEPQKWHIPATTVTHHVADHLRRFDVRVVSPSRAESTRRHTRAVNLIQEALLIRVGWYSYRDGSNDRGAVLLIGRMLCAVSDAVRSLSVVHHSCKGRPEARAKMYSDISQNASTCAPSGFRTPDPLIKSQLLYQLS
jgi:hypothetical protein